MKGFMLSIDNSQLQCYITCPRKYYIKYLQCLRKISNHEQELDLNFGKCFHKSLEILYKGGSLESAKEVFRKEFNPVETEKAKTPANGEALVEAYRNYWSGAVNDLSDTGLETVAVEVTERFQVSDELEWIVKIDRICKASSGYWVQEHKTASKLAYNYFRKFDLSMAVSGYCKYVQQKYGQCSGAIINVAQIGFRERKYKDEPAGFHCTFARDITNRNEEQTEDWRSQVLSWAQRLALDLKTSNDGLGAAAFPQNTDACWGYKGCAFMDICKSCNDQSVIDVMYEKYNPLEYLNEESISDTI